jgi:glycolate oxidase subunit GlcD
LIPRQVVAHLRAIVGEEGLLEDSSRAAPYECDGLAHERCRPEVVLLPRSTLEVSKCLALLHSHSIPVVPRGAGTGLTGGATPVEGGVLLGTARMRRVIEVNAKDRFARVEAGLVNIDLTRACCDEGLFYAPDPSSQAACSLGGNVANNSGGPHCFKHGNTTRHVIGLVIVMANGEVLDLSAPEVDPVGYDLVGLFVGSEGMFGIATEVTVRLTPTPEAIETLLGVFASLDDACDSVSAIIAGGWDASALEILDKLTIAAVEASVFAAGYPKDAEAVLLVEVEGSAVECHENAEGILAILADHGVLEVRRAQSERERQKLWAARKGAYGAMGRIAPDLYVSDVVVPRTKLREMVRATTDICTARGLKILNVFHAGDGNLHPNISYDRRDSDELRRVIEAGDEMARVCVEAGGTLSGEHGIGLEKLAQMKLYFSDEDLELMHTVRRAWDPSQNMNPGKLLPIRACMETRTRPVPVEASGRAGS